MAKFGFTIYYEECRAPVSGQVEGRHPGAEECLGQGGGGRVTGPEQGDPLVRVFLGQGEFIRLDIGMGSGGMSVSELQ